MIDTPCPACGANMLTREQYDATIATGMAVRAVFAALGVQIDDDPPTGSMAIRINAVRGTVKMEETE